MPDRRHVHKNTSAWPLRHNGSFTWNKKTRQIVFMRAGNPFVEREELKAPTYFYVEEDDIKLLYQVLHEHFLKPQVAKKVENWHEGLPKPSRIPIKGEK
jgi:hypothetical protein